MDNDRSGGEQVARTAAYALPSYLRPLVAEIGDDRAIPELGLGDATANASVLRATRAILAAESIQDVSIALARFVLSIGGQVVPAAFADGTALPADISLGAGPPVLACADPLSVARMRLEQLLPHVLEDARIAATRLSRAEDLEFASGVDPVTGLLSRRLLMRALGSARTGDAVCMLMVDHVGALGDERRAAGDSALALLAKAARRAMRDADSAGRYDEYRLVFLFGGRTRRAAVDSLTAIRDDWRRTCGDEVTFSAGVAIVAAGGGRQALTDAGAALQIATREGRGATVAPDPT